VVKYCQLKTIKVKKGQSVLCPDLVLLCWWSLPFSQE
jgi:hypothetical protein